MDLQEQSNSVSNKKLQVCSRCCKTLPIELYFHNKTGKQLRTCIYCRTNQSKKSKRLQESNFDNDEPVIQFTNFDEFLDFYSEQLEEFAKIKENMEDCQINIECIINAFLFDGLPKEIANQITKQVSYIDEYSWK
jgi:hypothetical protein